MSTPSSLIPLTQAKRRFSELVDRVSRGEEFVITQHGVEIARLVAVQRPGRGDLGDAIARMRPSRPQRRASPAELLAWRKEGLVD